MRVKFISFLLLLLALGQAVMANISISWPVTMSVFQRNQAGSATIWVGGQCLLTKSAYQLQVRVKRLDLNTGADKNNIVRDWAVIASSRPVGGIFRTSLTLPGGWYLVEVAAYDKKKQLSVASVRVGVGEVFVIAGQSNAQGVATQTLAVTPYQGVVSDPRYEECSSKLPPFPYLASIKETSYIGPRGRNSWAYTWLGNRIAGTKNVPVAFFNAALYGTSVLNWKAGADNQPTGNPYASHIQICQEEGAPYNGVGQPYRTFRNTLNYYGSLFGMRGVIWHQGESDAHLANATDEYGNPLMTRSQYASTLSYVIDRSRTDFNASLNWFVARVSRNNETDPFKPTNAEIIAAQTDLVAINKPGPPTDDIDPARYPGDNGHFWGESLRQLGDAWYSYMINTFESATPVEGNVLPLLTVVDNRNGTYTLTAPAGYSEYTWVTNENRFSDAYATGQSITANNNAFRCYMKDAKGNVLVSQKIYVPFPVSSAREAADEASDAKAWGYSLNVSPNPSDEHANISLTLPGSMHVQLEILDLGGRVIKQLASHTHAAGSFTYPFQADLLPSGVYLCRLVAGDLQLTKRFLVGK